MKRLIRGAALTVGAVLSLSTLAPQPVQAADPATSRPDRRPNILLITTDDQSLPDLQYMPLTRQLIADQGVTLEGISPHPLCCPARAEILTGQYAQNNGTRSNKGRKGGFQSLLRPDATVAVALDQAGYSTSFLGKFLNGWAQGVPGLTMPGWDHFQPTLKGIYNYENFTSVTSDGVAWPQQDSYQTDFYTDLAVQRIQDEAGGKEPFFLWQSYVSPHTTSVRGIENTWIPPVPAARHRDEFGDVVPAAMNDPSYGESDVADKPAEIQGLEWGETKDEAALALNRGRLQALQSVDEGIAAMLRALELTGQADNTLVIFTSDNGYVLGQHRFLGKNIPYEPALAVPFLVRGPGLPEGVVRDRIGSSIDIAPTIMAAAGVEPLLPVDGRDLLPVLTTGAGSWVTMLIQAGARRPIEQPFGWFFRGVRTDRYTYVRYAMSGDVELYDRRLDPYQLDNITGSAAYATVERQLSHRLRVLQHCAAAQCRAGFPRLAEPGTG